MENDNKQIIILLIIIFTLASILIFSCFQALGKKEVTVATMINDKAQEVKNVTNKKNVVKSKENYNTINVALMQDTSAISNNERSEDKEHLSEEIVSAENKNNSSIINRFYYNKIDDDAKIIYDKLLENKENLKKGNYKIDFGTVFSETLRDKNGKEILTSSFTQSVRALLFDNPEIFFLEIPKLNLCTKTISQGMKKEYYVSIEANEGETYLASVFSTQAIINSAETSMKEIASRLTNTTSNMNDWEKIQYVHDYLIDNVKYDVSLEHTNTHDIYGALINKIAVCEGYAKSFKYILDEMQIPNIIVVGYAKNSENVVESHSWNWVNIQGKWYGVDVTFDDPISIEDQSYYISNHKYKYFLKGNNEFTKTHTLNPIEILEFNVDYPTLEEESYK